MLHYYEKTSEISHSFFKKSFFSNLLAAWRTPLTTFMQRYAAEISKTMVGVKKC
ncbi:hypothetical protein B0I21_106148 [Sphingobacterium paludis]|uniref:Uncharacterized protein n=1 Tax=Sphingobacterium paludis TaxID=1476465 RepID=A0A4R7CVS6_9SPHI|nr:hypothetical protein B0I21_106148 [Sphingobacterium paludis]